MRTPSVTPARPFVTERLAMGLPDEIPGSPRRDRRPFRSPTPMLRPPHVTPVTLALAVFLMLAIPGLHALPSITSQPVERIVDSGAATTFAVTSTSPGGTLSYQWQVSTNGGTSFANVPAAAPYSGVTAATLSITAAADTMNGYQYRCVITQTSGTSPGTTNSTSATLYVARTLAWDPGTSDTGTQVFTIPATSAAGRYYFKVSPQASTVGGCHRRAQSPRSGRRSSSTPPSR